MEQKKLEKKKEKTNPGEGFGSDKGSGQISKDPSQLLSNIDSLLSKAEKTLKEKKTQVQNRCGC